MNLTAIGAFRSVRRLVRRGAFDCGDVLEHCSDYADDALPRRQSARFEAHLLDCPDCMEFVRSFIAMVRTLSGLPRRTPGQSLKDRVLARIAAESR